MLKKYKIISVAVLILTLFLINACNSITGNTVDEEHDITFIELGSVKCIPCQKMQSVMDSFRSNYGNQVKVIFYDVWTKEGKPYGKQYKIHLIPTQAFLDKDVKEYYRHEGYFPFDKVKKILKQKGIQ